MADPVQIKQKTIDDLFLTSPGEELSNKTLMQMAKIPGFTTLFGPYKSDDSGAKNTDQQRWADYNREDWSIRQLPALNVYESGSEDKESDNAYLNGTMRFQVFWPPNFRRSDIARVQAAFKGVMENFFASQYVDAMLDEHISIERVEKVLGLNQYGKVLNWTPNVEALVENNLVPATIVDVRYRIDLRAWYRELEFQDRTRQEPFKKTLGDLQNINGEYDGTVQVDPEQVELEVDSEIIVNP